jgi:hypothetical protein
MGGEDFDALEVEEIHPDERFPEGAFNPRDPSSAPGAPSLGTSR